MLVGICLGLGFAAWGMVLVYHNLANGDLWAKLAFGAWVIEHGEFPRHDAFAFTPVLPFYVDHEWGAGLIFFALLKGFGPASLLVLKVALGFGTLAAALKLGRSQGAAWPGLLLLAIPAAVCLLPAYGVVLRSHCFTFLFFALTLDWLERIRDGRLWPGAALAGLMVVWANVHGGFVAGLGAVAVYGAWSILQRSAYRVMIAVGAGCLLATLATPYGIRFWTYLVPALLHPRPHIEEWHPLPIWGWDMFIGFRILLLLTVLVVLVGWRRTEHKSWPGLVLMALTAFLAFRSRRHAPFFGVCALGFASPYMSAAAATVSRWVARWRRKESGFATRSPVDAVIPIAFRPAAASKSFWAVTACYAVLTVVVAQRVLPHCTFLVLAPAGRYPVREADILELAGATGNAAVPFEWGSYVSWRLYPRVKISCDGRYEAAYPESTFLMNLALFDKVGQDWDRMLREHRVDYVLLDLKNSRLQPADLVGKGYARIWELPGVSALWAAEGWQEELRSAARALPTTTIEPLDARIPHRWFPERGRVVELSRRPDPASEP